MLEKVDFGVVEVEVDAERVCLEVRVLGIDGIDVGGEDVEGATLTRGVEGPAPGVSLSLSRHKFTCISGF